MDRSITRNIALATLLLFVLVFVGLSLDVMARVWARRAGFPSLFDVVLLFYLEGVRTIVVLAGVIIAALASGRATRQRGAAVLAFAIALATLVYAKVSAFDAFPGAVQEHIAIWLGERGVTPAMLVLVFGHPEWAAWLALAASLRFAVQYPREITPEDIVRSGEHDRRGALRSVALAGADVGALARNAAAAALRRGWLRAKVVWSGATLLALAHTAALATVTDGFLVNLLALLVAFTPVAVLIALIRGGIVAADERDRLPLLWLRRGALYGGGLFVMGALITQLLPALPLGAIVLSFAPAATAASWLIAVRSIPTSPDQA